MWSMARRYGVALALALGLGVPAADAFRFGVPPAPGQPTDGWFVLAGRDVAGIDAGPYVGDVTGELHLFIEVTGTALDLCVWDPGHYAASLPMLPGCVAPSGCQLDFETSPGAGPVQMVFELYEPGNPTPIRRDDTSFGADDPTSDNAAWCFYQSARDGAVAPGVYEFVVRMPDGPGLDQQVNLFGIETQQDYDGYVVHATVGHSTHSGAELTADRVQLYPWVVSGSPGLDSASTPACGLDFVTYDLDAAALGSAPPQPEIQTRLGWNERFGPTADSTFRTFRWVNMAGTNFSDDHGIYGLEFRMLTAADGVLESRLMAPLDDFNAFAVQIYDFGQPVPFFFTDFPIAAPDPRAVTYRPRRMYLPTNAGVAPAKEFLGHLVTNPPPGGAYFEGMAGAIDMLLTITNPTGYDLTNLSGSTIVNPAADFSAPRNLGGAGGMGRMVTITGKTIAYTFARLRAGTAATISYTVDFTGPAVGRYFVTGDGVDFGGGGSPTSLSWETPFALSETAAPCMVEVVVVPPPCTISAAGSGPTGQVCRDQSFVLDATPSSQVSCPGGTLEYRWSGPGIAAPTFDVNPVLAAASPTGGLQDYTVEVRCSADNLCVDTAVVQVDVSTGILPIADAGGDRVESACDVPFGVGAPGDPLSFAYVWTTTAPVGIATLLDDPGAPDPSFVHGIGGSYDLTLTVTSLLDPACSDQAVVVIDISDAVPTGDVGNRLRAVRRLVDVELTWPQGVLSVDRFNLHRADGDKTELDKSALPSSYTAAVLNPGPLTAGTYLDVAPSPAAGQAWFYEVYGRDCAGQSVFP